MELRQRRGAAFLLSPHLHTGRKGRETVIITHKPNCGLMHIVFLAVEHYKQPMLLACSMCTSGPDGLTSEGGISCCDH